MSDEPALADLNELTRRLAGASVPEGSTLDVLRAELDSLAFQLRAPARPAPYAKESACEGAIEAVRAIGRDASFATLYQAGETPIEAESLSASPGLNRKIGSYQLLETVGRGGMGTVYKALHVKLDKVVALKVLPSDRLRDPQAVSRFEREMRAVGKLHHPNIIAAHDAGEIDGTHFLVMELVEGDDVAALVQRRGPLPIREACEIVRQAALGLQHVHEHGLVHRDIKPSNLMLSLATDHQSAAPQAECTSGTVFSAQVKILDLGLARLRDGQCDAAKDVTSTGQIVGTVDYMAPEQGTDTHGVDIRADIYSLGATLYKLVAGRAPFELPQYGSAISKLTALGTTEPESVVVLRPEIPETLAEVIHRMLAKSPVKRFTTPIEVARALAPFAADADLSGIVMPSDRPETDADATTDPTMLADTQLDPAPVSSKSEPDLPATTSDPQPRIDLTRVRRTKKWLLTGGLAAVLLAATVFRFVTRDGTLVVRLENRTDAEVRIDGQKTEIVSSSDDGRKLTVSIAPGEYRIGVFTDDGIELSTSVGREPVIIRAGASESIQAWLEAPQAVQNNTTDLPLPPISSDSERAAAEWVLRRGGTLTLNDGTVSVDTMNELPAAPFRVLHILLNGVPNLRGEELAALKASTRAELLNLGETAINDADLEAVAELYTLNTLSLFGCQEINGAGLAYLRSLPSLRHLILGRTSVSDEALHVVKEFPALERLVLADTAITRDGLADIADSPTLKSIGISGTKITGDDLYLLQWRSKQWEGLALSGDQVSAASVMHLYNLTSLRSLHVEGHCDVALLQPLPGITSLALKGGFGADDVNDLSAFHHLKSLSIRYSHFSKEDVEELHSALPDCRIESDFGTFEPTADDASAQ